jgi:ABC-type glutathione transport system ATPase component
MSRTLRLVDGQIETVLESAHMATTSVIPNYFPADQCSESAHQHDEIVKTFKERCREFTALRGYPPVFIPGEFVSVVGKSGGGKSTWSI